jgi:hypothetical protein
VSLYHMKEVASASKLSPQFFRLCLGRRQRPKTASFVLPPWEAELGGSAAAPSLLVCAVLNIPTVYCSFSSCITTIKMKG